MSKLEEALRFVDVRLGEAFDSALPLVEGDILRDAMRYALLGGGKRVRPFLVFEFGRLFGVGDSKILSVAMAIEALHCYSLVHDDLPCMDDSDLRRGRASLHRQYDEATAVLVGDGLQGLAFELVVGCGDLGVVRLLAEAGGGMVRGQVLDIVGAVGGEADLVELQGLKTGCLFGFCCESMCILGGVGEVVRDSVRGYGRILGLLFQMTDDLLDVGDSVDSGKVVGIDEDRGRVTWVSLLGEVEVRERASKLCEEGKECLSNFGNEADLLRDLLDYLLVRKK